MKIFNFFRKKKSYDIVPYSKIDDSKLALCGRDFEFLIRGEVKLPNKNWEEILTPNSMSWEKIIRDDWPFFRIGSDEFSYSWEMSGIQMTFNAEITYEKARKIADEVINNLRRLGQNPELVEIFSDEIAEFD